MYLQTKAHHLSILLIVLPTGLSDTWPTPKAAEKWNYEIVQRKKDTTPMKYALSSQ